MTELLLNLLWLMVALAGMGLWLLRWGRTAPSRGDRREMLRSAIGLACALVLLFFAISLTDDLQAAPLVAEEARTTRRVLEIRKSTLADPDPEASAVDCTAILPTAFFFPGSLILERLATAEPLSVQSGPNRLVRGRSPPATFAIVL